MTVTLLQTTKNWLLLKLTTTLEDTTVRSTFCTNGPKRRGNVYGVRTHTRIPWYVCGSRSDSQMIYGDPNASAASVPLVLMFNSPGRLSVLQRVCHGTYWEMCYSPEEERQGHSCSACLSGCCTYMCWERLRWWERCIAFIFRSV